MTTLGPIAAFTASCTWAVGSSTYGILARNYSAYSINFMRAIISLPLFFAVLSIQEGGFSQAFAALSAIPLSTAGWLFSSMIASYGLGDFFFFWSTRSLGVPRALAIASSYPLLSAMAGWIFMGEQISWLRGAGLVLTVVGVVMVILADQHSVVPGHSRSDSAASHSEKKSFMDHYGVGVLFGFFVSAFWALNTFSISKVTGEVSAVAASTARMIMTIPLCVVYSFVGGKMGRDLLLRRGDYQKYGWAFALESFGGSLSFVYGLTHSPLAVASALSGLAPVLTVPYAIKSGREKMSFRLVGGILLAVVGAWMLVAF